MKLSSLFSLTLCIPFFSDADTLTQANPTFIEASNVSSWNHIGEKHGVYAGLSQAPHNYQLKKRQASSPSNTLYELILVKKLLNWEQQHSNGFEVSLAHLNLNVEQLTQLHFKIKLSADKSIITSDFETLSERNNWLNNTQNHSKNDSENFTGIFSEQAHFTIIFYGENHENPEQKTLYAAYPFKLNIDSNQQWHAINITTNDINYYWQQNYQEESVLVTEVVTQKWQGFILIAESGNSKVVRNYIPDTFPKEYTEVFNEFDIRLTNLKVTK